MFRQQLEAELTRADQVRDAADETTDNYMYFIGKYSSELQNFRMFMKYYVLVIKASHSFSLYI